ncbi:MAG: hypothetical protein PVF82_14505 [Gammaproteobacteria bacterium]
MRKTHATARTLKKTATLRDIIGRDLDEVTLKLSPKQLTYTIVALRKHAKLLSEKDQDTLGDNYQDLLMVEGIIQVFEQVRKENIGTTK